VTVSGSGSPTTVQWQISAPGASASLAPPPATARSLDAALRSNPFSSLQPSLQPVDVLLSDKPPSSPDALEAALHAWYDSVAPTIADRDELTAVSHYVRATISHLKLTDCRHVLEYHRACASAAAKGLYYPGLHGDVYPLAYAQHIGPHLFSSKARSQRDWPGIAKGKPNNKRKADHSSAGESTARCDLPGHGAHTLAECFTRHPELRLQKGDGKTAPPASKRKKKSAHDDREE
jgi:hypothetical protein